MGERPLDWAALLADAVRRPGVISNAYVQFWHFSSGNQLLALFQCCSRGIEPGPINTFLGWKACGRSVRKGEKALTLCMPVTGRRRKPVLTQTESETADAEPEERFTRFIYRPRWFVLSQTDGEPYVPTALPVWHEDLALATLDIQRIPFKHMNGNVQGYARERAVAVSPIAHLPHRTLLHEVAHVILGHTAAQSAFEDDDQTPRTVREVEAEAVALICSESLGLHGAEYSRGYLQHWLGHETISERSAQRIFKAADLILVAGRKEND
jgi:hypothetical protein